MTHPTKEQKMWWSITIVGYGAFLFEGTEEEAEGMRRHKARWEGGVGHKRHATAGEIAEEKAS